MSAEELAKEPRSDDAAEPKLVLPGIISLISDRQ